MFNRRKISLALGMLTAVMLTAGALISSTAGYTPSQSEAVPLRATVSITATVEDEAASKR